MGDQPADKPTERMLQIGEMAYLRFRDVERGTGIHRPRWNQITASSRASWAEAGLVAFNMGVHAVEKMARASLTVAMGGDDPPVPALVEDLTGLGWRKRALVAEDSEKTLREDRSNARGIARVLAHAYKTDNRPPPHMIKEALAFPVRDEPSPEPPHAAAIFFQGERIQDAPGVMVKTVSIPAAIPKPEPRPTFTSFVVTEPTLLTSLAHAVEVLGEGEAGLLEPAFRGTAGLRGIWAVPHPEHAKQRASEELAAWRSWAQRYGLAGGTYPDKKLQELVELGKGELEPRLAKAVETIERYGGIDGAHHKTWVIDQVARALLDGEEAYKTWVVGMTTGENEDYEWDEGIAP